MRDMKIRLREMRYNFAEVENAEYLPSRVILFAYNFVRCPCSRSDIMPP